MQRFNAIPMEMFLIKITLKYRFKNSNKEVS